MGNAAGASDLPFDDAPGILHAVRVMKTARSALFIAGALAAAVVQCSAEVSNATVTVSSRPLHAGRINPMLFGNFMELLDDLVPSMWAEMLNDRSFEGVIPRANWAYEDGALNMCDREWEKNATWAYDTVHPFNGARGVRLTSTRRQPAVLTQSDLAVKTGAAYVFTGYFRADKPARAVTVMLKARLPKGGWATLASAKLPRFSQDWRKYSVTLVSAGQSGRVVFEVRGEGQGSVWADKLSLLPADNRKGWRPDAIEAIKESRPGVVRWGGSTCDPGEYRWKNGIGDRDARVPFPNRVWGRIDSNDVGLDEFCQFCELVEAQPLVCLSFSDGPQSAGDLVEYCNGDANTVWGAKRAANGHPAPYRVKYWQIGNEISGDDENYLGQFAAFVQKMKQADPGILLLASFPTQKLLDRAGRDIAYVGPHHYTPDLAACESDFNHLSDMIRNTPGCGHIKMAVTEWNVSAGNWGVLRSKFKTLETALLNARYLNLMMRHADKVELACRSNMANSLGSGIIETTPSGLLKRPSFYAMRLYSHHAQPVPWQVESATEGLDVFVGGSEDQKTAVIFAVNSRSEPVACAFGFNGWDGAARLVSAEVLCDTLDARQPDVMNHWNAPDRVRTIPLSPVDNRIVLPALSAAAIECKVP
jgi:alpha-L-arabinofuranosidase